MGVRIEFPPINHGLALHAAKCDPVVRRMNQEIVGVVQPTEDLAHILEQPNLPELVPKPGQEQRLRELLELRYRHIVSQCDDGE